MADHILARYGGPESATAFGPRGVEAAQARSWAGARQREGRPVLVLATAFALAQWLDGLERLGLKFRLPAGSAVFETGGFKGKDGRGGAGRISSRACRPGPACRPASVVREYGMTELTSQCYTGSLLGEDPDLFRAPHWVRVRILDPETLEEVPAGTPGLICRLRPRQPGLGGPPADRGSGRRGRGAASASSAAPPAPSCGGARWWWRSCGVRR